MYELLWRMFFHLPTVVERVVPHLNMSQDGTLQQKGLWCSSVYMGVSWNGGSPIWMVYVMEHSTKTWMIGGTPISGNHQMSPKVFHSATRDF